MIVVDQDGSIARWVCQRTGGVHSPVDSVAIGNVRNGRLAGAVLFDHYNKVSIAIHCAGDGHWMTRDFLGAVFDYPFNFLKVHKLVGLVDSSNTKARRLDEHLGFTLEATVKGCAPGGDLLIYTMNRQQCRFLTEKYHGEQVRLTANAA